MQDDPSGGSILRCQWPLWSLSTAAFFQPVGWVSTKTIGQAMKTILHDFFPAHGRRRGNLSYCLVQSSLPLLESGIHSGAWPFMGIWWESPQFVWCAHFREAHQWYERTPTYTTLESTLCFFRSTFLKQKCCRIFVPKIEFFAEKNLLLVVVWLKP